MPIVTDFEKVLTEGMDGTTVALADESIVLKVSCATACSHTVMKNTALKTIDNIVGSIV